MRALFGPLPRETSVRFICLSLILLAGFSIQLPVHAEVEGPCALIVHSTANSARDDSESIAIPTEVWDGLVNDMEGTIAGENLATVYRSEWKLKLPIVQSNQMAEKFFKQFLSQTTFAELMNGLDVRQPGYVRNVMARIDLWRKSGRSMDDLPLVNRNEPIPFGVTDKTLTYYTPSLRDAAYPEAKIQPRIRTYIRLINFRELAKDFPVKVFDPTSGTIRIFVKTGAGTIREWEGERGEIPIISSNRSDGDFTIEEIEKTFGGRVFYAPHGRNFKLEMKVALKDQITSPDFKNLAGSHMVLKVDTQISFEQVREMYNGMISTDQLDREKEAMGRILSMKTKLIEADKTKSPRISAIFAGLAEGASRDPEFLRILRAVTYPRTAIDSKQGWQLTLDRESRVYDGPYMYKMGREGSLQVRAPWDIVQTQPFFEPGPEADRHDELKYGVPYVKMMGLNPYNRVSVPNQTTNPIYEGDYLKAAEIFNSEDPPLGPLGRGHGKAAFGAKHGHPIQPED